MKHQEQFTPALKISLSTFRKIVSDLYPGDMIEFDRDDDQIHLYSCGMDLAEDGDLYERLERYFDVKDVYMLKIVDHDLSQFVYISYEE